MNDQFSLSAVELRVFQVGQPKGVTTLVDLSGPVAISAVVVENYLTNFDAENQIKIAFDTVQRRGFICQLNGAYDKVVGEFFFTDEVFWRAVLDEATKGKLSTFLAELRGKEHA